MNQLPEDFAKNRIYTAGSSRRAERIRSLSALGPRVSPSTFHQHFRDPMSMSPLEYQKRLHLNEARRLMLGGMDAAGAAFRVGYESASQFSRAYSRLFGAPPKRYVASARRSLIVDGDRAGVALGGTG